MMLKRSEALAWAGVTDRELRRLEDQGLVVPFRRWTTLWLIPYYHLSQVEVIRWLVSCQRAADDVREREARLVASE